MERALWESEKVKIIAQEREKISKECHQTAKRELQKYKEVISQENEYRQKVSDDQVQSKHKEMIEKIQDENKKYMDKKQKELEELISTE